MVFSVREGIRAIKHISLGWTRMLGKRADTYFIPDYEARGLLVQRYVDAVTGQVAKCNICGYARIRLELPNGWLLEECSANPSINSFTGKEFAEWVEKLPATAKQPVAHV
jgi:hypothetical protein